ncbi:dynein heavy chain, putative [Plasmodium gallinaceum]|uniref:Dynein heavy chain, putative n=1 Tax=Plasmodium gallinaceum TaxID=5849 RepID=A0A1J1H0I7_PLAGA|nr:dynein heavy chain, putative [Plasmodium gallinaceum]CRG98212.1 dynein heavy chain, putative [Plasmodium gallinaceum]
MTTNNIEIKQNIFLSNIFCHSNNLKNLISGNSKKRFREQNKEKNYLSAYNFTCDKNDIKDIFEVEEIFDRDFSSKEKKCKLFVPFKNRREKEPRFITIEKLKKEYKNINIYDILNERKKLLDFEEINFKWSDIINYDDSSFDMFTIEEIVKELKEEDYENFIHENKEEKKTKLEDINNESIKIKEKSIVPFKAKGVISSNVKIFESIFDDIYIYGYNYDSNLFKVQKKGYNEFYEIDRIQFFFTSENPILYVEKLINAIKNKSNNLKRKKYYLDIDSKCKKMNCIINDVNEIIENNESIKNFKNIEKIKNNLNDFCNIWLGRIILNNDFSKYYDKLYINKKEIKYYNYDFENKKNIIKQCVLLENKKVIKTFLDIINKCALIQISIFDTSITSPFEINDFFQLQNTSVLKSFETVNNIWMNDIKFTIEENLKNCTKGNYSLKDISIETFKYTKIRIFFNILKFMIEKKINEMLINNIENFINIFANNMKDYKKNKSYIPVFIINITKKFDFSRFILDNNPISFYEKFEDLLFSTLIKYQQIEKIEKLVIPQIFKNDKFIFYKSMKENDIFISEKLNEIRNIFEESKLLVDNYLSKINRHSDILNFNINDAIKNIDINTSVEHIQNIINKNLEKIQIINETIEENKNLGLFLVKCKDIKLFIINEINNYVKALTNIIVQRYKEKYTSNLMFYNSIIVRLKKKTNKIQEIYEKEEYIKDMKKSLDFVSHDIKEINILFNCLNKLNYKFSSDDYLSYWKIINRPSKIEKIVKEVNENIIKQKNILLEELINDETKFQSSIVDMKENVQSIKSFSDENNYISINKFILTVQNQLAVLIKESKEINYREKLFNIEISDFSILLKIQNELNLYYIFWLVYKSIKMMDERFDKKINTLNYKKIEDDFNLILKNMNKINKHANEYYKNKNSLIKKMNEKLTFFNSYVSLLISLRKPSIKDRHKEQIAQILDENNNIDFNNITFNDLLKLNINNKITSIINICEKANKENSIEKFLGKIKNNFSKIEFQMKQEENNKIFIISNINEILTKIEENLVLNQNLLIINIYEIYHSDIINNQNLMINANNIINTLKKSQNLFLYLSRIFILTDISKQLINESKKYKLIYNNFLNMYKLIEEDKKLEKFCSRKDTKEKLTELYNNLNLLLKSINEYLDLKREIFNRFYFLSTDDLINLISSNINDQINAYLFKIFNSIYKLVIVNGHIIAYHSQRGEELLLCNEIKIEKKEITEILVEVEKEMFYSVKKQIYDNILEYQNLIDIKEDDFLKNNEEKIYKRYKSYDRCSYSSCSSSSYNSLICENSFTMEKNKDKYQMENKNNIDNKHQIECKNLIDNNNNGNKNSLLLMESYEHINKKINFVLNKNSQFVLIIKNLFWSNLVELFLKYNNLNKYKKILNEELYEYINIINKVDKKKSVLLHTLIISLVHNRDIVEELIKKKVNDSNDFNWLIQLKYFYYNKNLYIKYLNESYIYGYEYIHNDNKIILTNLINKYFISILHSYSSKLGVCSVGSAGTGKTETTKYFSKFVGKFFFVYNCSSNINFDFLKNLFFGIATNGIFFCFDEFNRISIEALSVLAQQLCNLFNAKSKKFVIKHSKKKKSLKIDTEDNSNENNSYETDVEKYTNEKVNYKINEKESNIDNDNKLKKNVKNIPSKKNMLFFEGKYININEEFNIFIIINPFYKGRSVLPNNIKALFRFFNFIKPDFFTIVEVMLYSKGYKYSKILSKKIILLFELCEHNLSYQKHYKYDLRTVKKITYVMGKIIVGNNNNQNIFYEYKFLFIAIIECIMPSIVKNDIYLFLNILKNIFYELYTYNQSLNTNNKKKTIDLKNILSNSRNNDNGILLYLKSFYCNMNDENETTNNTKKNNGEYNIFMYGENNEDTKNTSLNKTRNGYINTEKEKTKYIKNNEVNSFEEINDLREMGDSKDINKNMVDILDNNINSIKEEHKSNKTFLNKKEMAEDYLKNMLKKKMLELNYVCTNKYVNKLIQLYNMINFHTGILFLSYPLSKTTSYKILNRTINTINDREIIKTKINDYIINANVVRELDLLGFYEEVSNKWVHGILTKKILEINSNYNSDEYLNIIYFDCYLHSLWIENLNSVLDESKILCLSKCDIIPIHKHTHFIMETYDLKDITMATISRCGLIILNDYDLNIAAYICSYINMLSNNFDTIHKHILLNLFIVFFYKSLLFIYINNLFVYTFNEYYYCISFIRCLDSLFSYCLFEINNSNKKESFQKYITSIFIYSLIWSVGSNTYKRGRKIFNDFLCRNILKYNLKLSFETLEGRIIDIRELNKNNRNFNTSSDNHKKSDMDNFIEYSLKEQNIKDISMEAKKFEETESIYINQDINIMNGDTRGKSIQENEKINDDLNEQMSNELNEKTNNELCEEANGKQSKSYSEDDSEESSYNSDIDIYNEKNKNIDNYYESLDNIYDYYLKSYKRCKNLYKNYDINIEGSNCSLFAKSYGNNSSDSNSSNDSRYLKRKKKKKTYINKFDTEHVDDIIRDVNYYNDIYNLTETNEDKKENKTDNHISIENEKSAFNNVMIEKDSDNNLEEKYDNVFSERKDKINDKNKSIYKKNNTIRYNEVKIGINLFDFYFNYQKNVLSHLNNKENKFTSMEEYMNNTEMMIKQKKNISMLYNIDIFIRNKKNIIISGCNNIGKSLAVDYYLNKVIPKDKFFTVELFFSNSTKSKHVRNYIESKLTKRRNNFYGTTNNRICVFYIDDINIETDISSKKRNHYLSSHEFLRMLFNYKFFVDKNLNLKYIEDLTCLATMNNAYSNNINSRLYNNFNIIYYNNYNYKEIYSIFFNYLKCLFSIYDINIKSLVSNLIDMQINIYKTLKGMKYIYNDGKKEELFLNFFNINNIKNIFKYIFYLSKNINIRKEQMLLYFLYENKSLYVESFKLKNNKKRCTEIIKDNFKKYFNEEFEKLSYKFDNLLFCNFLNLYQNVYEEVYDINDLYNCVHSYISEYNNNEKINIILFDNILIYICKITKTFMIENSHILSIGINDTIKKNVNKICAFIINKNLVISELNKNSKKKVFKEEIKRCLFECGIYGKKCVYYLNDENSNFDFILENLNNIYNYNDSYLLYNQENLKKIYNECKNKCEEEHLVRNLTNIYNIYKKTIRKNFHVSLNISLNSSNAILKYPYILKNSHIIYFEEDNNEGLYIITKNFFKDSNSNIKKLKNDDGIEEKEEKNEIIEDKEKIVDIYDKNGVSIDQKGEIEEKNMNKLCIDDDKVANVENKKANKNNVNYDKLDNCENVDANKNITDNNNFLHGSRVDDSNDKINVDIENDNYNVNEKIDIKYKKICVDNKKNEDTNELLHEVDIEMVNYEKDFKCLENIIENKILIRIHKEIILLSKKYYEEKKINVCINSNKYIHLLHYFDYFYNLKKIEFDKNINLYSKALSKLHKCEQDIKVMKNHLLNIQPILNSTNIEMKKKVNEIERDTKDAYVKRSEIKKKESEMKTKIKNITNLKNEVNEEISKSFALLNESLNNLNKLKVEHLRELKAFVNPPSIVVMVIQCILTFLKEDEKYLQSKIIKPKTVNYWILAQKTIFRDSKVFLDNLKHYDKNLIEEEMIVKITPLIKNKNFNPKFVRKASKACETMCQWILAIYHYFIINKELKPKKEEVVMLEKEINKELEYLEVCKGELNIVNNNLSRLEKEKEEITEKQNKLVEKIENIKQKIKRSKIILSCLLDQEIKWNIKKNSFKKKRDLLIGNCIIISSLMNYISYFSYEYRTIIKLKIQKILNSFKIKYSKNISIYKFLESKINLEKWITYGLTNSKFYFENVVIMNNSIKYNLLIDPHFIVTSFLKNFYHKKKDVEVLRNNSSNFIDKIERYMQLGNIILFTHYDDDASILFSSLFNYKINKSINDFKNVKSRVNCISSKETINNLSNYDIANKEVNTTNSLNNTKNNCVNFNNKIITINSSFNIYFIVYGNTYFDDSTQNYLNIIDFNINLKILEEYFLENLIEKLSKSSNENRRILIHQIHDLNNQMMSKENEILNIMNYKEDILSDDSVVVTFENANNLFHENKKKIKEFKINKKEIMKIRQNYISMSEHISIIYICIDNLISLNPFYNFSILSFVNLLNISIDKSEENKIFDKRKKDILNIFTQKIHYEISRTLSEKHQQIFFFYLVCMINIYKKEIEYDDYYFFIYDSYPENCKIKNEIVKMVTEKEKRKKEEKEKKKEKEKEKMEEFEKDKEGKAEEKEKSNNNNNIVNEVENNENESTTENNDTSSVEENNVKGENENYSLFDEVSLHNLESEGSEDNDEEEKIVKESKKGKKDSIINSNLKMSNIKYMQLQKTNENDDFMNLYDNNLLIEKENKDDEETKFVFDFETKKLSWLNMKEYISIKKLIKKEKYYLFFKKVFNEYEHIFRSIKTDHTILQHKNIKNLLSNFEKLIIYKIFRFDVLNININNYVDKYLNITSPRYPKDLYKCYEHSSKNKLILILSERHLNTASEIMILNEKITGKNNLIIYNKNDKNYLIQILNDSIKNGFWVLIENAHLNIHLILEIEKYIEICNIQYSNPEFRIWISTNSVNSFPYYLLKLCVKVTFENVYNLKSCLLNIYSNIEKEEEKEEEENQKEDEDEDEEENKEEELEDDSEYEEENEEYENDEEDDNENEEDDDSYSENLPRKKKKRNIKRNENESILINKLNFSLCFFHALIQERNKFKNKGFNNYYEFTDIELKLSKENICKFFNSKNIDINLLIYLIGNIIYGGIIIDLNDQKCFNSILKKYINEKITYSNNEYKFNNNYYCPHSSNKNIFLRYIKSLQFITDFSIFNLHPSLNILYLKNYNMKILKNLERLECNVMKEKTNVHVLFIIDELKKILPSFIDTNVLNDLFLNNLNCSIITFLNIEVEKYNNLLRIIYDDLTNIINFIKGKTNFKNICHTYNSIINLSIPKRWITNSFYSDLQIFHFAKLIKLKISYINKYIINLDNKIFNLASFMSPKSLMLAIREKFSKEIRVDANNIKLKYEISNYFNEKDIKEDNYFIGGIFIEGAAFDVVNLIIKDSSSKQLYYPMPFIKIHFANKKIPNLKSRTNNFNFHIFKCPIYKNINKTDNNLDNNEPIFYLKFNSKEKSEKWVERNVSGVLILK